MEHSARLDKHAAFFAAQRSTHGAGCFGSCWAALHYLCSQHGVGPHVLKQLSFWTRCHFLTLASAELAHPDCSVDARELRLLQWACGRTAHSARKLLQAGKLSEEQLARCLQPLLDRVLDALRGNAEIVAEQIDIVRARVDAGAVFQSCAKHA